MTVPRPRLVVLALAALVLAPGWRFAVVGDSVTYDSRQELEHRGASVRAYGGVTIVQGRPAIREFARNGAEVLVIALGRMDLSYGASLGEARHRIGNVMRQDIDGIDCVVWLDLTTQENLLANWPERARAFNTTLHDLATRYGVHVARWSDVAADHPRWFRADFIHLRPVGQEGYADFVARSANQLC
jgi:hypothetical protein